MKNLKLIIMILIMSDYIKSSDQEFPNIPGAARPVSLFPGIKNSSAVDKLRNIKHSKSIVLDEKLAEKLIDQESLMRDYFYSIEERELLDLILSRSARKIEHYLDKLEKKEERLMQEQERLRQEQKPLIQAQIKVEMKERSSIKDLIRKEIQLFSSSNVNQDLLMEKKALDELKNRLFLQIQKDLQVRQVSSKTATKLLDYFLFEFEDMIYKFYPKIKVQKVSFV